MNAGNRKKQFLKYLNSLPVVKKSETINDIFFELRRDEENKELIIVRYEDGKYDYSMNQSDYQTQYFNDLLKSYSLV